MNADLDLDATDDPVHGDQEERFFHGYYECLPIRQYTPLFSLLGITYGGDGTMNFGLPDLVGRAPHGSSPAEPVGTPYGNSTVTAGNQQPNNRASALAMTWCIAYQGMFPERPRN